jgi:hypothetical protein
MLLVRVGNSARRAMRQGQLHGALKGHRLSVDTRNATRNSSKKKERERQAFHGLPLKNRGGIGKADCN